MIVENEKAIRAIVKSPIKTSVGAFSEKHLSQLNHEKSIVDSTFVSIKFPNGKIQTLLLNEFNHYGMELEHRTDNIILNMDEPQKSIVYETDFRGEVIHKEYIQFNIQ